MVSRVVFLLLLFVTSVVRADLEDIVLPPGFTIEVFAEVPNARSLTLGDQGTIFVSNRRQQAVYAVVPREGREPEVLKLADNLDSPNGIAFFDGDLFVAEVSRITRYKAIESNLTNVPAPDILNVELPSERHHGWRYIGFGPDNKLYVSIGAPCNVCDKDGFAQIVRMNPDGSERETFARGIRNSVGFTWHPQTDELWFTDNGRDMLGDNLPPGELNHAPVPGMHFGFPYCHAGEILDPTFGEGKSCADYVDPAQKLGPHVAPLGVKFYTGESFPKSIEGRFLSPNTAPGTAVKK